MMTHHFNIYVLFCLLLEIRQLLLFFTAHIGSRRIKFEAQKDKLATNKFFEDTPQQTRNIQDLCHQIQPVLFLSNTDRHRQTYTCIYTGLACVILSYMVLSYILIWSTFPIHIQTKQ